MKLQRKALLMAFAVFAACWTALLASCKSAPLVIPADLPPAEIFQRAQDAADSGNYALAIRYYTAFRENHPDIADRNAWAQYEIAFNYHKMGKNAMAVSLIDQLLKLYQTAGDTLPPAPRILALKLKDRLAAVTASGPAASAPAADAAVANPAASAGPAPAGPAPAQPVPPK